MRKRLILSIIFILIVVITLICFVSYRKQRKFTVPTINSISSIKICVGRVGAGKKDELKFNLNSKKHLDMASNILLWLKNGRMMENAKDEFILDGASPTILKIELKDGTSIIIKSALGSKKTEKKDCIEVDSYDIPGQVTIYINNNHPIRESSPELKSFINGGWKSFFNYAGN